eukprot:Rhum_TRINITY_DN15470_c3_g2::Rhum_TRINITY_DN15470_c3_g2_i1::g.158670::m.158670
MRPSNARARLHLLATACRRCSGTPSSLRPAADDPLSVSHKAPPLSSSSTTTTTSSFAHSEDARLLKLAAEAGVDADSLVRLSQAKAAHHETPSWIFDGATLARAAELRAFGEEWPYLRNLARRRERGGGGGGGGARNQLYRDYDAERQADPAAYKERLLSEARSAHDPVMHTTRELQASGLLRAQQDVLALAASPAVRAAAAALPDEEDRSFYGLLLEYEERKARFLLGNADEARRVSRAVASCHDFYGRRRGAADAAARGHPAEAAAALRALFPRLGEWWEAHACARWYGVHTLDPETTPALLEAAVRLQTARCLAELDDVSEAQAELEPALAALREAAQAGAASFLALGECLQALMVAAELALRVGNARQALAAAQEALELEADAVPAQELVVRALEALGRQAEAAEQRQRLEEVRSEHEAGMVATTVVNAETGEEQPFEYHVDTPEYLYNLAGGGWQPLSGPDCDMDEFLIDGLGKMEWARAAGAAGGDNGGLRFASVEELESREAERRVRGG